MQSRGKNEKYKLMIKKYTKYIKKHVKTFN